MANIKHVDSVVDREFRNRINQLIDVVNSIGTSLNDLVVKGVMTTEQYSELITAINGLVKIGEINLDTLSGELKTEIEKINNKVDKGNVSVSDINKNLGKIDQTFLTDELLQQIAGNAPINAVPADYSITTKKHVDGSITFDKLSTVSNNLFYGRYETNAAVLLGNAPTRIGKLENGVCAVVEIPKPGVYIIKKLEQSERFRVVGLSGDFGFREPDVVYDVTDRPNLDYVEIKVEEGIKNIVIYLSATNQQPAISANEVGITSDYLPDDLVYKKVSEKNLYRGSFLDGALYGTSSKNMHYLISSQTPESRVATIEIEPNETYTITPYGGDRNRYAVFNKTPTTGDYPDTFIFADDGNKKSVTFTNDENGKFLMLYLSSSGENVRCQVEKGSEATPYDPYLQIDKNLLPYDDRYSGNDNSDKQKITDKFLIFDELNLDYQSPPQESVAAGEPFDLQASTHDQIYAMFDDLADAHDSFVKVDVGTDDFGLPLRYYKSIPIKTGSSNTDTGNTTEIKRLKVILTSGVHGNEKIFPYTIAKFFEDMYTNYGSNSALEFMRFNVDFIVIPVINPSGYDDNTRPTRNGVNINRNFSHNWTFSSDEYDASGPEPFSETETMFVKKIIDQNLDASLLIDSHTFSGGNNILWSPINSLNDENDVTFLNDHMSYMSRFWRRRHNWFPQDDDRIVGHINKLDAGTVASYGLENGIRSYTGEIFARIPYKPGWKMNDETVIEFALEYFVNKLIGLIKVM